MDNSDYPHLIRKSAHFIRKSTLFRKALTPEKNATFRGMEGFVESDKVNLNT